MNEIWIKEKGSISETELSSLLEKYSAEGKYYVAFHSDGFMSGKTEGTVSDISVSKLLELRIFSDKEELLVRRSALGAMFSYRVASDEARHENFLKLENTSLKEEMTYSVQFQTLDINRDKSEGTELISTVGGKYHLPVDENKKYIKVMTYYFYDDAGMANAVDYRLCDFVDRR